MKNGSFVTNAQQTGRVLAQRLWVVAIVHDKLAGVTRAPTTQAVQRGVCCDKAHCGGGVLTSVWRCVHACLYGHGVPRDLSRSRPAAADHILGSSVANS